MIDVYHFPAQGLERGRICDMAKPTLHDVARAAGVSYATADRVLNARGGVAEKSAMRVRQAIDALGYQRDLHAANLSRQRTYRFRFLLPHGDHGFFIALREALAAERAARAIDRIAIEWRELPALDSDALAGELERTEPGSCDCLALVGVETPRVAEAIARLAGQGLPVITLVADAAPGARAAYVGIDNMVAGRTAGRLVRLAHGGRPGRILPIIGAQTSRDHRDRLEGMRAVLAEPGAALELLPPVEVQDRTERMRERVGAVLAATPGITGIYSIGAGNRALFSLLEEGASPRPFVLVHELTPHARRALEQALVDAVIDQRPRREIAMALDVMRAIADGTMPPASCITPAIYLKDNLPAGQHGGPI